MNEKKPLIIAGSVLLLIVIAGSSAIYYLNFVKLPEREKVLAAAVDELKKAQAKKALIPSIEASIKDLKDQELKKKSRIPDLDRLEYDGLAVLLDDFRKRAGVDVAKGTFSTPKAAAGTAKGPAVSTAGVHKVQYDLGVKGGFHQLLRYLNMLEKDRRFLNVESFSVLKGSEASSAKGKGSTHAVRELKVAITSYTYRVPPPPTKPVAKEDEGGRSTDVPE